LITILLFVFAVDTMCYGRECCILRGSRRGCSFFSTFLTILLLLFGLVYDECIWQEATKGVEHQWSSRRLFNSLNIENINGPLEKIVYTWKGIRVIRSSVPYDSMAVHEKKLTRLPDDLDGKTYAEILKSDTCGSHCNTISNLKSAGIFSSCLFIGGCIMMIFTVVCLCIVTTKKFQEFVVRRFGANSGAFIGNRRLAILFCFVSWIFSLSGAMSWLIVISTEAINLENLANEVYTSGQKRIFGLPTPGISLFAYFTACLFNGFALVSICFFSDRRSRLDSLHSLLRHEDDRFNPEHRRWQHTEQRPIIAANRSRSRTPPPNVN